MAELRWLLLVTGIVLVGVIYLYTRYKPRFEERIQTLASRREPSLDNAQAGPDLTSGGEPGIVPDAEPAPEQSAMPADPTMLNVPPGDDTLIIAIRLMPRDHAGFRGDQLILTMRDLGLQHGAFGIFHRCADTEDQRAEFSVASLIEPGAFDLKKIKTDLYPGVSIFMQLPGARNGVEVFDDMLQTSRLLARRMEGELLDEHGSTLSVQRERYLREEIIAFEHQGSS